MLLFVISFSQVVKHLSLLFYMSKTASIVTVYTLFIVDELRHFSSTRKNSDANATLASSSQPGISSFSMMPNSGKKFHN